MQRARFIIFSYLWFFVKDLPLANMGPPQQPSSFKECLEFFRKNFRFPRIPRGQTKPSLLFIPSESDCKPVVRWGDFRKMLKFFNIFENCLNVEI